MVEPDARAGRAPVRGAARARVVTVARGRRATALAERRGEGDPGERARAGEDREGEGRGGRTRPRSGIPGRLPRACLSPPPRTWTRCAPSTRTGCSAVSTRVSAAAARGDGSGNVSLNASESGRAGLSKAQLESLPLAQRVHALFARGQRTVLRFARVMHFAPAGSDPEEVLAALAGVAHLVQGCWVACSALRCGSDARRGACATTRCAPRARAAAPTWGAGRRRRRRPASSGRAPAARGADGAGGGVARPAAARRARAPSPSLTRERSRPGPG